MKRTLFIANWKANPGTFKDAKALFDGIKKIKNKNQEIVICAPFTYVGLLKASAIKSGAQSVSEISGGAYTGEVTAEMLRSVGVAYCIVGHSERRKRGESSTEVSEKIKQLLKYKITPILCVGEKARGHNGEHFEEITHMLLASIAGIPKSQLSNLVLAYEPLWAISTEKNGSMDAEMIHETMLFLRKVLTDTLGKKIAQNIRIIYGGSVDSKNAHDVLTKGMAQGFLVGKAGLNIKSVLQISEATLK
jgi:triosephosphate isomerase